MRQALNYVNNCVNDIYIYVLDKRKETEDEQ